MPPRPTARHFSSTTTRLRVRERARAPPRAATAGRSRCRARRSSRRRSRISSTASLTVPSTEPSATTIGLARPRCDRCARGRRRRGRRRRGIRSPRPGISSSACICLCVREVAHLGEGLRTDHRADRDRLGRIEHLPRLERRQERIDLRLRRHVDALVGVREDEAVHAHHHRQRQLLGEPERLDVQVERFLVGLGEELDPAAVALRHAVGVVVPDVDRRADGAVRRSSSRSAGRARRRCTPPRP